MISKCKKYIAIMILAAISYFVFIKPIMYEKKEEPKEKTKKISGGKIFGGNLVKELIDYNNMDNPMENLINTDTNKIEDLIAGIKDIDENKPEEARELTAAGITKTIRDNIQERLQEELDRRSSNSDNTNTQQVPPTDTTVVTPDGDVQEQITNTQQVPPTDTTVDTPDDVMPDQTINSQPETPDDVMPDQTMGPQPEVPEGIVQNMDPPPPETPDDVMPDQTMGPQPEVPEGIVQNMDPPPPETTDDVTTDQTMDPPPVETSDDTISEEPQNRPGDNVNDERMKNIEDLNSAQDIQLSNIQEKITLMEQNMQNIEEQNNNNNIEDKMKQTLNELRNLNTSSKKDIEMNKKNIDVNNKNIKRINQINKSIEELYKQKSVMAEEDEIMVGGNNKIKRKVEQIFKTSMNGGKKEKNTQELAVDIFDKQEPLKNDGNNYAAFEKNKFFEY